jgi:predicted DNA-binding protein (MmcQ/YjbR family)
MPNLADVRRIALALPEAHEQVTWDTDVTFRVRGKIFAMGAEADDFFTIKSTPDGQADLIDMDPDTYSKAAYVGRFGWISVDGSRVSEAELERLLVAAWRLTAPKRLGASFAGLGAT